MFGASTKNLQQITIHILSKPSSAFGGEHNWSMFEHIHSKRRNRLSVQKMNRLVFVHYNLRIRIREILDSDASSITLEEVDPESEWITEATDPIFDDEDLQWLDQADREGQAEAVAMAAEDQRAPVVPSGTSQTLAEPEAESTVDPRGTSQADAMATETSRTYIRRLTKRHFVDYTEPEVEAAVGDDDDDEDDDEDEPEDEDDDEDSD